MTFGILIEMISFIFQTNLGRQHLLSLSFYVTLLKDSSFFTNTEGREGKHLKNIVSAETQRKKFINNKSKQYQENQETLIQ